MANADSVCNIAGYPGLGRACRAYGLNAEQLTAELKTHNPIDRLALLAKAKVSTGKSSSSKTASLRSRHPRR